MRHESVGDDADDSAAIGYGDAVSIPSGDFIRVIYNLRRLYRRIGTREVREALETLSRHAPDSDTRPRQ
jgi:hypothetical protein